MPFAQSKNMWRCPVFVFQAFLLAGNAYGDQLPQPRQRPKNFKLNCQIAAQVAPRGEDRDSPERREAANLSNLYLGGEKVDYLAAARKLEAALAQTDDGVRRADQLAVLAEYYQIAALHEPPGPRRVQLYYLASDRAEAAGDLMWARNLEEFGDGNNANRLWHIDPARGVPQR